MGQTRPKQSLVDQGHLAMFWVSSRLLLPTRRAFEKIVKKKTETLQRVCDERNACRDKPLRSLKSSEVLWHGDFVLKPAICR